MNKLERRLSVATLSLGLSLAATGAAQAADFAPCDDAASKPALAGSLCAVERAAADPSGLTGAPAGEVQLFVRKFPATGQARGQVWLVAGGPGESGASFYGLLPVLRKAFAGFDLLVPDHRGTGFSTRLCPDEESAASPGGAALAGAEWASCFRRLNENPAYARQFSQTNAAHDLKRLIASHPGQGQTWVYGVSYGTQLVLRTLALGAANIDGVVLDSLVPLQDDASSDLSRRSLTTDAAGRKLLAWCDGYDYCHAQLDEPAEAVYRRVLARFDADPALQAAVPGKNLKRFFGASLDVPGAATRIPYLLKDLEEGKTEGIAEMTREIEREAAVLGAFPQSPPSIALVSIISGSENNLQPGRERDAVVREEQGLLFSSPLPGLLIEPGLPLYPRDAMFAALPQRLPRTLVIQGERDAKTPYDAALRHVAALRTGGPVEVFTIGDGAHFALWTASPCVERGIDAFVGKRPLPPPCQAVKVRWQH